MDDFEYSVQISEIDWDSFFQACEECNMLPPGLARLEESGMSDMDDLGTQRTQTATHTDPELQTDALPDSEGSPVELYLSKYGLSSPDQVLSGSEDDFHLETINVFFERLKSVSVTEDHTNLGSKMAGHSEGSEVKEDTKKIAASEEISQSCGKQKAQSNDCHTYMYSESTDDDREVHKSTCPDTELFIKEENWSLDVLKEGDKWDDNIMTQPDHEKNPCNVLVNGKELTDPNQFKEAKSQLVTSDNSDLLVAQSQAFNITPRRRRRKKKRMSVEMTEMGSGFEAHLPSKVSDSDEDTYGRRGEIVRETHIAEYCGSGTVTEASSEFLVHPKKNSISENFSVFSQSVSVKGDMRKSTQVSPNLQELSRSTVRVAQCKREIDMSVGNLSETSTKTGKIAIRPDLKSPESGVSVTETPQRDENRSANTNGDNVGICSQLNNNLPSEMLASIASSDVSNVEGQPVNRETLVRYSVSNHTDNKSQADSTALQIAPLIHSLTPVYSKTPTSQFEDRVMLSDFHFDGSNAVGQRKTSTSCVTFPELTSKTFFSASFKNTERKEISSSVNHDEVPHENKSDGLPTKGCLSETFPFQLLAQEDQEQISHQNNHKTQMSAAQISKIDEIKDAPTVEPKADITNEMNLKMSLSKNPSISNTSQNLQNEDWKEEIFVSLSLNNVPESPKGIHTETIQSPDFKGDRNEVLSLKGQTKEYQSLIHTIDPDSQLSVYTKSEPTLSNIIASSEEQKGFVLSEDKPPYFSSKDHDLSPTKVQHSPSPPPGELTGGAKSLETLNPDSVNQPTPPVYAISSFWNEMEKLTINDILRLRLVGQAQHPSVLQRVLNGTDGTDAADSGYFTHSDESKPDHSSGNMTFISDFDGEFAQFLTPDAAKQDKGTNESPKPTGIIWESDPNLSGTATGMEDAFNLDTVHSSSLFRNNSNQCFRKMCKNISVQNLQALEGQNLGKIQRNASLHSIHSIYATHSEVEDNYVDPFNRVETSSPVYLSDEEEMESTGITFSEIFEYLFGSDEPSASETNTEADSYPTGTETSFPEMYDHFFSEFEPESLPRADNNINSNDELVPIFSSSRSATRNAQFPEVYDYFFPDDSPVHSDEDEEPEHTVIRVVTRYDHNPTKNYDSVTASDPYKHIFSEKDNGWNFVWTNPFSFRRVRRTGVTVPREKSSSQDLTPVKNTGRSYHGGIQPICMLGADESPFPDPLILNLENSIFRQLAEQQKICRETQTTVADPRLDAPLLPIKQADMCLVCIAFASWVLKSVNPQGADTWKAVLLANISALSAIRYLRRFTKDEAAKISPLRQIKPA